MSHLYKESEPHIIFADEEIILKEDEERKQKFYEKLDHYHNTIISNEYPSFPDWMNMEDKALAFRLFCFYSNNIEFASPYRVSVTDICDPTITIEFAYKNLSWEINKVGTKYRPYLRSFA